MSSIAYNTIDENYPLAGQDNDSQGFRDNFSVIKDALATAASEITVLENTSAKMGTGESNDFLFGIISNVQLSNAYKITQDGNITTNQVVVANSDYFRISKADSASITINWPNNVYNNYIKIRVEVTAVGPWPVSFFGDIKTNFSNSVNLLDGETAIFDCWIAGNITTTYIQLIDKFA